MRVEDFSLFFGPKLITLGKRNGTEYNIRTVPLGGFVKVTGMEPEEAYPPAAATIPDSWADLKARFGKQLAGLDAETVKDLDYGQISERILSTVSGSIGEDGRLTAFGKSELEGLQLTTGINSVEHAYIEAILKGAANVKVPDPDGYNQKPLHQRASVIFAGPLVSLLFGYLIFCVMGFTTGLPDENDNHLAVGFVSEGKPAEKAGLKAGDYVLSVNGTPTDLMHSLAAIRRSVSPVDHKTPVPLTLEVMRAGEKKTFTVTPNAETDYLVQPDGKPIKDSNGKPITGTVGMIGIGIDQVWRKYSIGGSIARGSELIKLEITGTLQNIFSRKVKDNVGGIITIGRVINQNRQQGSNHVLFTAALLSISLGILNLFPIPVLDGGHLLLLSIEFIRRRRLSASEVYGAQMVGICIIGVLFVFVMYNDIMRMVKR
jgi:regulator of sigma E protease